MSLLTLLAAATLVSHNSTWKSPSTSHLYVTASAHARRGLAPKTLVHNVAKKQRMRTAFNMAFHQHPSRFAPVALRRLGGPNNPDLDNDPAERARLNATGQFEQQAEAAMTAGQYAQAEALCLQWLGLDASDGSALRLLGEAREAQGNMAGALAAFRSGVEGPGQNDSVSIDRTTRMQLVIALLRFHQWAEAVNIYETTMQADSVDDGKRWWDTVFDPNVPDEDNLAFVAHYLLSYLEPRDKERSAAWYKTHLVAAMQIKPDYAPVHLDLGDTLEKAGDLTGAQTEYARGVQLAGNDAALRTEAQGYYDRVTQRIADQQSGGNGGTGGSGGGGGGYPYPS